jgi:hypothetical protein
MSYLAFEDEKIEAVSEALHIAEDKTGDYYKFSFGQWKRHHYEVKTLISLAEDEITSYAFALLNKCSRVIEDHDSKTKIRDFYIICLQDHQILNALLRDKNLTLLSLLVYIFTHELVHIIRFCNFYQRFNISGNGKEKEEKLVHNTTYEILKDISLPRMDYILESYKWHRLCDIKIEEQRNKQG